jgi:hypothetical protein
MYKHPVEQIWEDHPQVVILGDLYEWIRRIWEHDVSRTSDNNDIRCDVAWRALTSRLESSCRRISDPSGLRTLVLPVPGIPLHVRRGRPDHGGGAGLGPQGRPPRGWAPGPGPAGAVGAGVGDLWRHHRQRCHRVPHGQHRRWVAFHLLLTVCGWRDDFPMGSRDDVLFLLSAGQSPNTEKHQAML